MLLFVNLVVVVMVVFFALAISSSGKAAETKVAVDERAFCTAGSQITSWLRWRLAWQRRLWQQVSLLSWLWLLPWPSCQLLF